MVDNDSHCSFGWGVEAWEMTHRQERRREKQEGNEREDRGVLEK